jgi:serine/threonine-protein kinase
MVMAVPGCINEADLRAFVLGDLPERLSRSVAEHLETCPRCAAAVRRFDGLADPFLHSLLRVVRPGGDGGPTPPPSGPLAGTAPETAAGPLPVAVGGYQVMGELGRGGMSVVYLARQASPERLVALKMILAGAHADAERRARLLAEADAMARLQHPHIVQVYEVGNHEGLPFLALEFLPGGSLGQRLGGVPLEAGKAASLLETIARAVHHGHQRGVIHRDLKPGNILLTANPDSASRGPQPGRRPEGEDPASAAAVDLGEWTVKVADFGLAKLERKDLTATGALLGTPSYMAPEQARGSGDVGPAADVYALGAILYECLTGRPPFRAATPLDTLAQVVEDEPVPPRRLVPRVPRDLETVCLKCLEKDPARRYASAQGLAEDLRRFQAREPIQARPVQQWERLWRWGQRNPLQLALVALVLLTVLLGAGGGLWWWNYRTGVVRAHTEQERAVRADLEEVVRLLREWKIADAHTVLVRAEGRLGGDGSVPLSAEVQQLRDNLSVARELEQIRLRKATIVDGGFNDASAARDYAALFRDRELGKPGEDPELLAERIGASPIRAQLVAALDDWALTTRDREQRAWLLGMASRADPGVGTERIRAAVGRGDPADLERVAREANVAELSPHLLTALARALQQSRIDAVPLLRAAQEQHPADFWLNFHLGNALREVKLPEAIGYYRAALVARPDTASVLNNLGNALMKRGEVDEASRLYRRALSLDPGLAHVYTNLGNAVKARGHVDEAIRLYRKAIALDPGDTVGLNNLGNTLTEKGELDEAVTVLRRAITLHPGNALAHYHLGNALVRKRQMDEAIQLYRQAIALDRRLAPAYSNLGISLHSRGEVDEAIQLFRQAIVLDPRYVQPLYNLGNVLMEKGELNEAVELFRQAIAIDSRSAQPHGGLGEALLRQGRFAQAREATARGLELLPPSHPLRKLYTEQLRDCEQLLALDEKWSAILQGQATPKDAAERIALARLCQRYKQRYATAARFYAEAFAEQPKQAENLRAAHRYNAACAAACAAGGQGADADRLEDQERARLRRQALDWLRADLAAWTAVADKDRPRSHPLVRRTLQHWQKDADLASLRGEAALAKVPAAEREGWYKLWAEVDALLRTLGKEG